MKDSKDNTQDLDHLTPRQRAQNSITQGRFNVDSLVSGKISGPVFRKLPLAAGIGVAAAYMHYAHGFDFAEAAGIYQNIADSLGTGAVNGALRDSLLQFSAEPLYEAWYLISRDWELAAWLYGTQKAANSAIDYLRSEQGQRRAQINTHSPLSVYQQLLNEHDPHHVVSPTQSWKNPFRGTADMLVQKGVALLRKTPIAQKLTGLGDRKGYSEPIQANEVNLLQQLVFMHQLKDDIPEIGTQLKHNIYKHKAFESIFANSEALSKALSANIKHYHKFSCSVYRALDGLENAVFAIRPGMPPKEKETLILQRFDNMASESLKLAYHEQDLRQVMQQSLNQIMSHIRDIDRNEGASTVTLESARTLQHMIKASADAMRAYDNGYAAPDTVGNKGPSQGTQMALVKVLDRIHVSLSNTVNRAVLQGVSLSDPRVDLTNVNGVSTLCRATLSSDTSPKQALGTVWSRFLPDVDMTPTIDGLAAAALIENIEQAVYRQEMERTGQAHDHAKSHARDVTNELTQRAAFDYSRDQTSVSDEKSQPESTISSPAKQEQRVPAPVVSPSTVRRT